VQAPTFDAPAFVAPVSAPLEPIPTSETLGGDEGGH
jgi:hypothetical protein